MKCKRCQERLSDKAVYCHECGTPTGIISTELSALNIIRATWNAYTKTRYYALALWVLLFCYLPAGLAIYASTQLSGMSTWSIYAISNALFLITFPLLLIPFGINLSAEGSFGIKTLFSSFKYYGRFFVFIALNCLYFFLVKIICIGDPILNLVRFVLVIYWIAIVLPVPSYMIHNQCGAWRAILTSYKKGFFTRWQHFFVYLILAIINACGAIVLGFGLLITIPFTYQVIDNYYLKIRKFELID